MSIVPLNYKSVGKGEAILILHGLFGSLDNWQTMARNLSENGYRVITVDLRNHGKSPHTDTMSHQLMAADVAAFMREQELENSILMGHSMGGKTAMQLAMTSPELIGKLIVVDIAPKPYSPHHHTYFDAMLGLNVDAVESRRDASEKIGETIKSKPVKQFLLKNLDRSENGYEWKFNLPVIHASYENLIDGLETENTFEKPTLFISGQLSDYISKGDSSTIERLFPNNQIKVIKNSGHWVHAEQPTSFQQTLLNFLNESS